MKNITVVVNKNWEVEPVLNAMTHPKLRPERFPFPCIINSPKDASNRMDIPRAVFTISSVQSCLKVTVWCIEDLMSLEKNPSSSEEKHRVLPSVISAGNPDLVISVSTANYPSDESFNGSVVIGGNFCIYDGGPDNPESQLILPSEIINNVSVSNVNRDIFSLVDEQFNNAVVAKFITPPNNPALSLTCLASEAYSAVSSINVTDYSKYEEVDQAAVDHFHNISPSGVSLNSIETTHGVVKISTDKPIIFLSPITDRLGHFDEDVSDTQNYVAAFNGGLVLGQFLCSLSDFVERGNNL